MSLSLETIYSSLKPVIDPVSGRDIVTANVIDDVVIDDDTVRLVFKVEPSFAAEMEAVRVAAEKRLAVIADGRSVSIVMTAHNDKPDGSEAAPANQHSHEPVSNAGPDRIPGIGRIIAVASGKGGVGKSTVAANLACALAHQGQKVGLLDADVYGPSQPRMLGISGRPASPDGQMILPLRGHGVTLMSIGLLAEEGEAVAWRGPMLMGALQQMLTKVQWGALDVLIVDLPPGTGDVQMTLAQSVHIDGAVVVSTPQDIALIDARKGIDMFRQMNVPISGIVENMSTHICSACGYEEHIFGNGGAEAAAKDLGIPHLASIPLHIDARLASDGGTPIVISNPESAVANAISDLARKLLESTRNE